MKPIELDAHTHTLASGHAYSTINEMAYSAAQKGLKLLGITEHTHSIPGTCDDFYFGNLNVVPRELCGVQLMLGAELNILDYNGTIDLPVRYMEKLDHRIASIHGQCYTFGDMEQNTAAVIGAIRNPYVDIIGHPDDSNCPLDYEKVVRAAAEHHVLLEINNNSLRAVWRRGVFENSCTILKLCKKYDIPVICDSDAHFMTDVGNMDHVSPVFDAVDFPEELIISCSAEKFNAFIAENRRKWA